MPQITESATLTFLIIISIIIIINFSEILILIRSRKRLTNYECLLLSLAISDLLVGLSKGSVHLLKYIGIRQVATDKERLIVCFSVACSLSHTIAITLDRLLAVAYPMKHRVLSTRKNIILLLIIAWSFSLIVFPTGFISMNHVKFSLSVLILAISLLIIMTYSFIIYKAVIKRRRFLLTTNSQFSEQSIKMKREFNLVCMCFLISITFITMSVPFSISALKYGVASMSARFLLIANSIANPMMYFFWKYIDRKVTARRSKKIKQNLTQQSGTKSSENNTSKIESIEEDDSDHIKSSQITLNQIGITNAKLDLDEANINVIEAKIENNDRYQSNAATLFR